MPCLASHALHTWDDWGCPDVRPLLPDPSSQHRPTSVLTAARLGSRPRFLDIGHARFLPPLRPQPRATVHAQFRPAHRLPHEVSPLRCPVPRTLTLQSTVPLPACSPLFHIALAPSSWYLIHGGTDMLDQDGLGFSARRSTHCSRPGCHAMAAIIMAHALAPHTDIPSLLRIS